MALRFQLPLSVRIQLARRAVTKATEAHNYAKAWLACHYDNDGNCFDNMGISALRAMVDESKAMRARWAAEDALSYLEGLQLSRSFKGAF